MWNSSWNEKDKKAFVRSKKIMVVALIGSVIGLVSFTIFLLLEIPIGRNITLGILCVFAVLGRIFAYDINFDGAMLMYMSTEQRHKIDENGIEIYDKIKDSEIEEFYDWEDIDYIEYTRITDSIHSGQKMILLVKNKNEFYNAISTKSKFADKAQRRIAKITNGCFIQCSDNELIELKAYYDREII